MSQDSQQRFELLERGLQQQAQALGASIEALSKRSNVVDIKGVGKPEVLKGSHEEARKAWKSWAYKFESWFASQYPGVGKKRWTGPRLKVTPRYRIRISNYEQM